VKAWVAHSAKPEQVPWPEPQQVDLGKVPWPVPGRTVVRFVPRDKPFAVDVEFREDEEEGPVATGIAVRVAVATHADGSPDDPWKEGADFAALKARDLQRLPLASYVKAATAIVTDPFRPDARWARALTKRGTKDDEQLLARHAQLVREGRWGPAAIIARELGVETGTVRTRISRAKARVRVADEQRRAWSRRQGKGKS
jgi:hypothetical protein